MQCRDTLGQKCIFSGAKISLNNWLISRMFSVALYPRKSIVHFNCAVRFCWLLWLLSNIMRGNFDKHFKLEFFYALKKQMI